jgi:hypothetical protein
MEKVDGCQEADDDDGNDLNAKHTTSTSSYILTSPLFFPRPSSRRQPLSRTTSQINPSRVEKKWPSSLHHHLHQSSTNPKSRKSQKR